MKFERDGECMYLHYLCPTVVDIRHRDYGKVEDMLDTRVPLHNDDAFQHGIKLKAKVCEEHVWIADKMRRVYLYTSSLGA